MLEKNHNTVGAGTKVRVHNMEIQSFRSVGRCILQFEHLPSPDLWVLVGENNSGKTTILEALNLLCGSSQAVPLQASDIHDYPRNNVQEWAGREQLLRLKVTLSDGTKVEREAKLDQTAWNTIVEVGSAAAKVSFLLLRPRQDAYQKMLSADVEGSIMRRVAQALQNHPESKQRLVQCLKSGLGVIPAVSAVEIVDGPTGRPVIWIDDGTRLPANDKSPGLQKITILTLLEWLGAEGLLEGLILGFDEPEAHLHPQLIKTLARRLERLSKHVQIFVTTHSPYFVRQGGLDRIIRVQNRFQSAEWYGLPVVAFWDDTAGGTVLYNYKDDVGKRSLATKSRELFPDYLFQQLLSRPAIQTEAVIDALFAFSVILVEGESEQIYIPWLYQHWRSDVFSDIDERMVPAFLDDLAVHMVPMAGHHQALEILWFLAFFNINYVMLIDYDNDSVPQKLRRIEQYVSCLKSGVPIAAEMETLRKKLAVCRDWRAADNQFRLKTKVRDAENHGTRIVVLNEYGTHEGSVVATTRANLKASLRKKFEIEDLVIHTIGSSRWKTDTDLQIPDGVRFSYWLNVTQISINKIQIARAICSHTITARQWQPEIQLLFQHLVRFHFARLHYVHNVRLYPTVAYDHQEHAGNRWDDFKHWVLAELVSGVATKYQSDVLYIDLHAGYAKYTQTKVKDRAQVELRKAVQPLFTVEHGKRLSSLALVKAIIESRRFVQWKCMGLENSDEARVSWWGSDAVEMGDSWIDGPYRILNWLKEHPGGTVMVFVDPPFEEAHDWLLARQFDYFLRAVRDQFRRIVFVMWYPIEVGARPIDLPGDGHCLEFRLALPMESSLSGCGMAFWGVPDVVVSQLKEQAHKMNQKLKPEMVIGWRDF